ncbi:MAG: hypothetical protein AAFX02_00270 [Pseudomonadota bacterium]
MRQLFWMMVGLCMLSISACASTAVGSTTSALVLPVGQTVAYEKTQRLSDTLVVIRYPSVIAPNAVTLYADKFRNRPIGGFVNTGLNAAETERLAESLVAKTNYFVMSLYDSLRADLPENSVVLSPHIIEIDANGRLTSTPLMEAEDLPTVMTVDFTPYSFPDGEQMMNTPPLTFGDLISPLLVVRTDYRARPGSYGLLMASSPLVTAAYAEARSAAQAEMGALTDVNSAQYEVPGHQRLAYISYLDGPRATSVARGTLTTGSSIERVQIIPAEKLALPGGAMVRMRSDPSEFTDILESRYARHVSDRLVDLLNTIDHDRATLAARMRAISVYDAELADLYLSSTSDTDVADRLLFAEKLLEAERRYLVARSDALYEGSVQGERGRLMREILAAEYDALEKRRQLAQQQNASTALAVLAVAGAVAASTSDDPNIRNGVGTLATVGAVVATTNSIRLNSESRAIGVNTMSALSTAFEEQISVQLDLIEGTEEITAASFADFREQLTGIYADQIGEIPLSAEICAFGNGGIWTGTCESGRATGRGRGVITNEDGSVYEYYGDAENGLASGTGLMLVSQSNSMTAFEGQFSNGQVNGVTRVHRSGQAPAARNYTNGRPVTGSVSQTPPKLFAPTNQTGS